MDILSNSTIVADEKFLGLLKNLEDMSFLSSRETIAHYSNNPNFIEYVKQIQVQRIQALQRVKSARALYPNSSLADLYDDLTMPIDLRKAHQENDRAVMAAYGMPVKGTTESDAVAKLFEMYQKLINKNNK